jgi:hypothetical protein
VLSSRTKAAIASRSAICSAVRIDAASWRWGIGTRSNPHIVTDEISSSHGRDAIDPGSAFFSKKQALNIQKEV